MCPAVVLGLHSYLSCTGDLIKNKGVTKMQTLTDKLWSRIVGGALDRIARCFRSALRETSAEIEQKIRNQHIRPSNYASWTEFSKFSDVPDKIAVRRNFGSKVEVDIFDSTLQRNRDLPDNIGYVAMGLEERKNEHLDYNKFSSRLFSEDCIQYGGRLNVIFQRAKIDMQPALLNRAEWLAKQLNCEMCDALTLAECFKRLGLDRNMGLKAIFGYYDQTNAAWRNGLQKIGVEAGRKYAEYFENLVKELDEGPDLIQELREHFLSTSFDMIESRDWMLQYHVEEPSAFEQMYWIEEMVRQEFEALPPKEVDDYEDSYISHIGDAKKEQPSFDLFGAFPLKTDADGLPHEIISEINQASVEKIKKIQQRMFNQNTYWGIRKAQYGWMTQLQKVEFWSFVNARKAKLADEAKKTLTPKSMEVIEIMKTLGSFKQKKAFIASYCAGNSFNLYGKQIRNPKPSNEEAFGVWAEFRRITQ